MCQPALLNITKVVRIVLNPPNTKDHMQTSIEIKTGSSKFSHAGSSQSECEQIRESTFSSRPRKPSLLRLVRDLTDETKTFLRQEINLAKTELSEKFASLARNGASVGIGGFIAYAGTIVLLAGLGFLIAWLIHLAGIEALFASFLGLFGIGLLTIAAGGAFVFSGLAHLRKESLAPERTIRTLQELKGEQPVSQFKPDPAKASEPKLSSAELQTRVESTEAKMGATLSELGDRVSPRAINRRVKGKLQAHPYSSGLVALLAGIAGGWLVRRRFQAE